MTQTLYFPDRDPSDNTPHTWDFSQWLGSSDVVQSAVVTANPSDLLVSAPIVQAQTVTVWLSGGTAGVTYTVACQVTSQAGLEATRSASVYTVQR